MDIRSVKEASAATLAKASYNPKTLAAIHAGAALLMSLVLTALNYLLSKSIDSTAGLSQMGDRAVLSTIQSVLSLAFTLALPFWEIGFLYGALQMARGETTGPYSLTEGFRRMGPVLRLYLLQFGMYLAVALVCSQLAGILFSFTPFLDNALNAIQTVMDQAVAAGQTALDYEALVSLQTALIPMYVIFIIVLAVVAIPLFYRFRMSQFAVMDDAPGALAAMAASSRMMRGNRLCLFKLDLSFWWYYAGLLLSAGICYADVLLSTLGMTLPLSADGLFFLSYGIYFVTQLVLSWQFASYVHTTYAHCYKALKQAAPAVPKPQPVPKNLPWEEQ